MKKEFTHIQDDRAVMVDIGNKDIVTRRAVASGDIVLSRDTLEMIKKGTIEKGNVFSTARVAAILAVKRTPEMIPMCHQIPITSVDVDLAIDDDHVSAVVEVRSVGRTGVEMEALTGVSVSLLTVWDMVKSAEKDNTGNYPYTCIRNIKVVEKIKSDQN
ncbi:cyclic pyranopterin monophosphate synthase MoaC [Methanolobus halotolerans]|uniref:Probable cyclic pyranopterin monophosphate synthase n=1 Tax=Methanolobus halotolerans TaxID=2052935 RepID=A0A4E0PYS7_9EURY|nr:cyclic pyranopterin monophosphate synthase MoaC [Methanolobus halotolerans]TGC08950.1 cyclic pyranopterin monophosphate synthase MoaC [Methanolobus halotolerans]